MRKSFKAVLFSAFVFPGSGHFLLRKYVQAALLAGIAVTCVLVFVSNALEIAQQISAKILSGEIPPDVAMISAAISQHSANSGSRLADVATWIFVICWLISIVDSYRLGRLQEKADSFVNKKA